MRLDLYWKYATRSLRRGGQRTLLALFCVAVGSLAIVALQLAGTMVNAGILGDVRAINGGDLSVNTAFAPIRQTDLTFFDQLRQQGVITTYTAVSTTDVEAQTLDGLHSSYGKVDAVDPAQYPLAGAPVFHTPGQGSLKGLITGHQVVVTLSLAQELHVTVGATIHINTADNREANVVVKGIINNTDNGLFMHPRVIIAWATYATLPSASNIPVSYSTIYADVPGHTTTNAAAAAQQLQHHFGTASIETSQQALEKEQTEVQNVHYFLQLIALLALLIGGVGIANTMQVMMVRRRTEIALLKTMGYLQRNLLVLFGLEAGLLGVIGGGIGAFAGVGVAFGVKVLVERVLYLTLPSLIDPLTVGSGIIVGVATALFFGLIPILQASQVRPQAVLRELPEQRGIRSRVSVALLALVLLVVFTGVALSILQDMSVALLAVGATGVLLLFLGGIFSSIAWGISKWPVLEAFRWWYGLLILPLLAVSLALYTLSPTFGLIVLALTLACVGLVLVPRTFKATMKMALRNIERQRLRTVTTLVALFIGVFTTGVVLIGGQNLQGEFTRSLAGSNTVNVLVLSSSVEKSMVEQHIQHLTNVSRKDVNTLVRNTTPLAINGTAFSQVVQEALAQGYTTKQIVSVVGGVEGYDLQHNQQFNADDITLKQGRLLTSNDAGTTDVLLPTAATQAPLHLKPGDHITLSSPTVPKPITVTIVGFYSASPTAPLLVPMLADNSVAQALSGEHVQYTFGLHVKTQDVEATVAHLRQALPDAQVITLTDLVVPISAMLNNIIIMLEAVASLAMLAGVIIIANTVTLALLERRREIGILKSIGYTSRMILSEVLVENGIVSFTGAFLALLAAVGSTWLLGKTLFGFSFDVLPWSVLSILLGAVAMCMAVAALTAWSVTRIRPLEILRYE